MNIPTSIRELTRTLYSKAAELFNYNPAVDMIDGSSVHFGDPEPVLKDNLVDYLGTFVDAGGFYRPPVHLRGLSKCRRANPHHGSILYFKRNMILKWFRPNPYLPIDDMRQAALDFVVLGNAYFQLVYNRLGGLLALRRLPGLMMRRGVEPGVFFQLDPMGKLPVEYLPGEVVQLSEPDIDQDIYGVPEYLGGLQSVLLSEDATILRRKINIRGHMGHVFVTNANIDEKTAKAIEEKLKTPNGLGFSNLYINIRKAESREPVKVIPIGDIATKDDYEKIKSMTMREVLGMHRMQPGIAGVIPDNLTGFGDLEKVMRVYCELEVPPLQQVFLGLNRLLPPSGAIAFDPPAWTATS